MKGRRSDFAAGVSLVADCFAGVLAAGVVSFACVGRLSTCSAARDVLLPQVPLLAVMAAALWLLWLSVEEEADDADLCRPRESRYVQRFS